MYFIFQQVNFSFLTVFNRTTFQQIKYFIHFCISQKVENSWRSPWEFFEYSEYNIIIHIIQLYIFLYIMSEWREFGHKIPPNISGFLIYDKQFVSLPKSFLGQKFTNVMNIVYDPSYLCYSKFSE